MTLTGVAYAATKFRESFPLIERREDKTNAVRHNILENFHLFSGIDLNAPIAIVFPSTDNAVLIENNNIAVGRRPRFRS